MVIETASRYAMRSWGNSAIRVSPMTAPTTVPSTRMTPFCSESEASPVAAISITVMAAVCGCGQPMPMGIR